jgi:hypothetical protein
LLCFNGFIPKDPGDNSSSNETEREYPAVAWGCGGNNDVVFILLIQRSEVRMYLLDFGNCSLQILIPRAVFVPVFFRKLVD